MKILVTGSKGFIGKELCKELEKRNYTVQGFDKSLGNDILNAVELEKACKNADVIVHLAALLDEEAEMGELRKVNVEGTKNALEAAVKARAKKFLFLSSTGVYGNFEGHAGEETEKNPSTNYEISKAEAEETVLSYQEALQAIVVRSALVLGPNDYWKSIAKAIKKGFPVIGSGKNKWQIIYYKDLVSAIAFLLESKEVESGEVFNVAEEPEQAKNLKELIELFKQELGVKEKTKHVPVFVGFLLTAFNAMLCKLKGKKTVISPRYVKRLLKNRNYSIEKIKRLGWRPKLTTKQAVKETVQEIKPALDSN